MEMLVRNMAWLLAFVFLGCHSAASAADEPLTVFVFAGQSNMVGKRARAEELPKTYSGEQKNVLLFDGKRWLPYRPGLGQPAGFGPEVSAAYELAAKLGTPVGIIKHSVGGTNLAVQWNPAAKKSLYSTLKDKVAAAGKARPIKVVGAFWMQGGADAKSKEMAGAYADNLDKLIAAMRRDFDNPTLPFVAGRSGSSSTTPPPRYPSLPEVRAAQEQVRKHYAWVDCDNLTRGPDKIHYDTPGLVDLGRRMAAAMQLLLKAK